MEWSERIQEAERTGRFTEEDKDDAACWDVCVVGEAHAQLPAVIKLRGETPSDTAPLDEELRSLGMTVKNCVSVNAVRGARIIYEMIQRRILTLESKESSNA